MKDINGNEIRFTMKTSKNNEKRKLIILLVSVCAIIAILFVIGKVYGEEEMVLEEGSTAFVTADFLNLHEGTQGPVIGQARKGSEVTILSGPDRNGYYIVDYGDDVVSVYGEYLTGEFVKPVAKLTDARLDEPKWVYSVAIDGVEYTIGFVDATPRLALRQKPDLSYNNGRRWIDNGSPVIITGEKKGGFIKVKTLSGREGWVYTAHITAEPNPKFIYTYETTEESETCWAEISWEKAKKTKNNK